MEPIPRARMLVSVASPIGSVSTDHADRRRTVLAVIHHSRPRETGLFAGPRGVKKRHTDTDNVVKNTTESIPPAIGLK